MGNTEQTDTTDQSEVYSESRPIVEGEPIRLTITGCAICADKSNEEGVELRRLDGATGYVAHFHSEQAARENGYPGHTAMVEFLPPVVDAKIDNDGNVVTMLIEGGHFMPSELRRIVRPDAMAREDNRRRSRANRTSDAASLLKAGGLLHDLFCDKHH